MRIGAAGFAIVGAVIGGFGCAAPHTSPDPETDRGQIIAALDAWPDAWAARDAHAVCDLFAPGAVLAFPGGPDRTSEQACAQFTTLLSGTDNKTTTYQRPEVAEVVVDGDLATVRLTWTGAVTAADGTVIDHIREKGLDVFRRQADGKWRITASYAFTP